MLNSAADYEEWYAAEMKKTIGLPDVINPGQFDFQFMFDPGSGPQLQWISFNWDGSSTDADWIEDYGDDNAGASMASGATVYGWATWLIGDGVLVAYYSDDMEVEKAERVSCAPPTNDPQSWIELGRAIMRSLVTAVLPPNEPENHSMCDQDDELFDDAPDEIEPGGFGFNFAYDSDSNTDREHISFTWDGDRTAKWVQDIGNSPGLTVASSAPVHGWASWRYGAAIIAYASQDMGIEGWARVPGIELYDRKSWVKLARSIVAAIAEDYGHVPGMSGEQYL
jgi:hypothetical protein